MQGWIWGTQIFCGTSLIFWTIVNLVLSLGVVTIPFTAYSEAWHIGLYFAATILVSLTTTVWQNVLAMLIFLTGVATLIWYLVDADHLKKTLGIEKKDEEADASA